MSRRRAVAFVALLLAASGLPLSAPAVPVEAPPPLITGADATPVPRPGSKGLRTVPVGPFLQAEADYAAGRREEALNPSSMSRGISATARMNGAS